MRSQTTDQRARFASWLLALLLGAILLAACSSSDEPAPSSGEEDTATTSTSTESEPPAEELVIGVAMKTQLQPRWEFDVAAMQAEAEELGVRLIVQWANDDPAVQASQVENLISQGIDALIITPVDSVGAGSSAIAAKSQGIPVVSYDVGILDTEVDFFVIRDNDNVGVLQAEAALAFAPQGKFVLIEGDAANDVAQAISGSHRKVLDGVTGVDVVYDEFTAGWNPQTALEVAENLLSVHNDDIQAFLTANDGMAGGVIQALKAADLAGDVFVSGLDADVANLAFILEGSQTMSVWTKIDEQGALAVSVAVALARGESPAQATTVDNGFMNVPTMVAAVFPVSSDNLCEFITEVAPPGWVSVEDVFGDPTACD